MCMTHFQLRCEQTMTGYQIFLFGVAIKAEREKTRDIVCVRLLSCTWRTPIHAAGNKCAVFTLAPPHLASAS